MEYGEVVTFEDVLCMAETEDAILVEIEGEDIWIPKSQVDDDSEVYGKGHDGRLVITAWIAKRKGLYDE
jgi:pectate lyase